MAAYRNGIGTVIIPRDNERDLEDIDQTVRGGLRFVTAETVDQVFAAALCQEQPSSRDEAPAVAAFVPVSRDSASDAALRQ